MMQAFAALGHGIEPKLIDDPVITASPSASIKPPLKSYWPGRVQRGTAPLTTATTSATSSKILISRLFPMTPSRRSVKGSVRESGSIRLWTRASRGSFQGENERSRGIYSPPMWAPFSATERRMSGMNASNRTATAAENENTSK